MNVERMKKLAATARAIELRGLQAGIDNIGQIRMESFASKEPPVQCGYAACLCGLAAAMFRPEMWDAYVSQIDYGDESVSEKFRDGHGQQQDLRKIAEEDLGISSDLSFDLFIKNSEMTAQGAIIELEKAIAAYEADQGPQ